MGFFLFRELTLSMKSAKKCWPYLKSYWEKSLYTIVVKRGEVCTVVKSLPVTWKTIYLHRICYLLHALECGRSSSKILHLQVMCGAWTSFLETSALLKLLSVGQNFIAGTTVVVIWACYGHVWSEMHCFLCCCQYITYRNKKTQLLWSTDNFYCWYMKHGKCYLWFGGFQSFRIAN